MSKKVIQIVIYPQHNMYQNLQQHAFITIACCFFCIENYVKVGISKSYQIDRPARVCEKDCARFYVFQRPTTCDAHKLDNMQYTTTYFVKSCSYQTKLLMASHIAHEFSELTLLKTHLHSFKKVTKGKFQVCGIGPVFWRCMLCPDQPHVRVRTGRQKHGTTFS